jgi:hypothetical protein
LHWISRWGTYKKGRFFFFLNKKEAKKTSIIWVRAGENARAQIQKVFCLADSSSVANTTGRSEGLRWWDGSFTTRADGSGPHDD